MTPKALGMLAPRDYVSIRRRQVNTPPEYTTFFSMPSLQKLSDDKIVHLYVPYDSEEYPPKEEYVR